MAKERLSKLQKWILIECYMNPYKKDNDRKIYKIWRQHIFLYFLNERKVKNYNAGYNSWKRLFTPEEYNKVNVSITRSLRTLLKNRYIDCECHWEDLICIYDKKLAKSLNIKKSSTIQEQNMHLFKTFKEAHNITFEEWSEKYNRLNFIIDPEKEWREYKDPHPDIKFEEWKKYKKENPNHRLAFAGLTTLDDSLPNKLGRNIKYIKLTDKGIKKAKELLNVN